MNDTSTRDALIAELEAGAMQCAIYTKWMVSAWAELDSRPSLATIRHHDLGWEANHTDTHTNCPYCGHLTMRQDTTGGTR